MSRHRTTRGDIGPEGNDAREASGAAAPQKTSLTAGGNGLRSHDESDRKHISRSTVCRRRQALRSVRDPVCYTVTALQGGEFAQAASP